MVIHHLTGRSAGRRASPVQADRSRQGIFTKLTQGKCLNGVFLGDGLPSRAALAAYARQSGKGAGLVMWFQAFNYSFDFPTTVCQEVAGADAVPFLKIEPWSCKGRDDASFSLDKINSGRFDERIAGFGVEAAIWGKPVLVTFGHEMNGDWYPWGRKPAEYLKAFNRFFDLCDRAGATNIIRVWNPSADQLADLRDFCPDERQFDVIAFDGYNFGEAHEWSSWRSFGEIFEAAIEFAARQLPGKPIIIGEFASAESGGDKAAWITVAYDLIKTNGQVLAATWFNADKETDWRFNSTQSSAAAYAAAIADEYYIGPLINPEPVSGRAQEASVIPIFSKRAELARAVIVPDSLKILGQGRDAPRCQFEVEISGLPPEAELVRFAIISADDHVYSQRPSVIFNNRATLTGYIHPDVAGEEQGRLIVMDLNGQPLLTINFRLPFLL